MTASRRTRLAVVSALAVLIAPGTWLRDGANEAAQDLVRLERLAVEQPADWPAALTLEGAWNLANANPAFGGFSALRIDPALPGFVAYSDRGTFAVLPRPPFAGAARAHTQPVPRDPLLGDPQDIESVAFDADSGNLWIGYEHHNAIRRLAGNGSSEVVRPEAMAHWGRNSGPESMVRLADGRFIVLAERGGEGLLFASDPVEGGAPQAFTFAPPGKFLPTDMALLPDGRVLILLRDLRLALPPFASMLMLADPAEIAEGEDWPLTELARIEGAGLRDNYEGLAIEADGEGAATLWIIADDNLSLLQRNLLLKLRYRYAAK